MPNFPALSARLALPAYEGLDDQAAADRYNAETVMIATASIEPDQVLAWAATGPFDAVDEAQIFTSGDAGIQRQVRAAAKAALRIFTLGRPLDLANTHNQAALAALVTSGVLSTADRDSLLALAATTIPLHAAPGGFGIPVSAADVHAARS